jgi:hypothetical protein
MTAAVEGYPDHPQYRGIHDRECWIAKHRRTCQLGRIAGAATS